METKKDIYNLWVQYTTKNEETFFRQFVSGFVSIWDKQLNLSFDDPPLWSSRKNDLGPHLNRLPDELLPAICKFLIIARDSIENNDLSNLIETELLLKCLTIICRHFENIPVIGKSDYVSNSVAIATCLIKKLEERKLTKDEQNFIETFSQFLEVIYDPYLTWRNFLKGDFADFSQIRYHATQLHVEIVPFIYDCFQIEKVYTLPEIGSNLINILASIISGSQNSLTPSSATISFLSTGDGIFLNKDVNNAQNGIRAICPATVSVLMNLLSKWECSPETRKSALNCFTIMCIVLQRSSPENCQIDLLTVMQLYLDSIKNLLKTEHFINKKLPDDNFEISTEEVDGCIDVNALVVTVENIGNLLCESESKTRICCAINEANFLPELVKIPLKTKEWHTDLQALAIKILQTLILLSRTSEQITSNLNTTGILQYLFDGLKIYGKPSKKLLQECLNLLYDKNKERITNGEILVELINWMNIPEAEQHYLTENLLKITTLNLACKTIACKSKTIGSICSVFEFHRNLSGKSAGDLLKIIEELGKHSIDPIELKHVFSILRSEVKFEFRKQLLQTLASISHHNLSIGPSCIEYLDIQEETDGITVPDIRKWILSGAYGFVLHLWVRLDKIESNLDDEDGNEIHNFRRQLFNLTNIYGNGFEFFIQKNGNFVVGVSIKKEFLTASVTSPYLLDGKWHSITVSITPPKRPFSYNQVNVYIDSSQKLGVTMKFPAFSEPFFYCTIGSVFQPLRQTTQTSSYNKAIAEQQQPSHKGMFPSLMEKTFLPSLVSQVPSYFSLPMRNTSSLDPNVKSFPIGMQDSIFGEPCCLKGQLGYVVLAESNTNVRQFFDAGPNLLKIISQDFELESLRFVFCYSPSVCFDGVCVDLAAGNRFNGHIAAKYSRIVTIQNAINSIGGTFVLLPILEYVVKEESQNVLFMTEQAGDSKSANLSPSGEDFTDWEVLPSNVLTEWKLNQNPVSCFLSLIKNFISGHELNQENLLKNEELPIIGLLMSNCNPHFIDVQVLMAVQLLVESVQNQMPSPNIELLQSLYQNIIFNFKIWSRTQFQIRIGHIQYINSIIKDDRKYFRKHFGIQFILDVLRQFYASPENLSADDAKTIRVSLLGIIKYYIQKEVNIKEVVALLSFISTVKYENLVVEVLEMLKFHMDGRSCKDQIFLLMYEPHTTEMLYALLIDKKCGRDLKTALLNFISCLLNTKRISNRHKSSLRLHETSIECHSLYPGLFSYMNFMTLEPRIILQILDQTLSSDSEVGYCGTLSLIHHLCLADINLKLEISQRLLTTTFTKLHSPNLISQQIGWQESISRLLVKKPISNSTNDNKNVVDDISFDDSSDILNDDLIIFDEKTMELNYQSIKDSGMILTEKLHAHVSEAAHVIESEIKDFADQVSGAVAGNISSVYSVIKSTTAELHGQLESLTLGTSMDYVNYPKPERNRSPSTSSNDDGSINSSTLQTGSFQDNESLTENKSTTDEPTTLTFPELEMDKEEQLVYLVSNILFTVLWRGIENNGGDTWKERGQVMACINLLGLNNELYCSHLALRLRILEMGVQAALIDLAEAAAPSTLVHQQNAAQLLRMVYDLVVLDPNEDDSKKCSTKLLDGVLALMDALMVFQQTSNDDWLEMTQLFLGLLLKCSHNSDPDIVAMATAKLHAVLQSRGSQDTYEIGYLIYSINKALNEAIEVGNSEQYSFLMPVMKALLEKSRSVLNLNSNTPDLPPTSSGPVFFHEFQMYCTSKQWNNFVDKGIKPLHDSYQKNVSASLWEPMNMFWAECYESCKLSSQRRAKIQMESRHKFQQSILIPWRIRQSEEIFRINTLTNSMRVRDNKTERIWKSAKRFLNGSRGAWKTE